MLRTQLFALCLTLAAPALSQDVGTTRGQGPAAARARAASAARPSVPVDAELAAAWSPWHVEHLLNRAGFGATPEEVARWASQGPEALVEHLLAGTRGEPARFDWKYQLVDRRALLGADEDARRKAYNKTKADDREQAQDFLGWWLQRMIQGEAPLRERLTLFWHGHFTSSMATVKRGGPMIAQNEVFRSHAAGNFGALLRAMLQDAALLTYLDNSKNKKGSPNENLAREVMELFTLGVGHYTEEDVREAARALTGYTTGSQQFLFRRKNHDFGRKTILGVTGRHDAEDLAEILLAQEACADWIAGKLITYFEGAAPAPERLARYGSLLRRSRYELEPLLRTLLLDPDFYRADVVAAKVQSPVDFVVGTCRRLGTEPPARVLHLAATLLGQQLFAPPNVKGWEGGMAWLSTASLMQRGNLAGALLGTIEPEDVLSDEEAQALMAELDLEEDVTMEDEPAMDMEGEMSAMEAMSEMAELEDGRQGARSSSIGRLLVAMKRRGYKPRISLVRQLGEAAEGDDAQVVRALAERLLAVEPPAETLALLEGRLAAERHDLELDEGALGQRKRKGEYILRRLAHLILSLPEAQLG